MNKWRGQGDRAGSMINSNGYVWRDEEQGDGGEAENSVPIPKVEATMTL